MTPQFKLTELNTPIFVYNLLHIPRIFGLSSISFSSTMNAHISRPSSPGTLSRASTTVSSHGSILSFHSIQSEIAGPEVYEEQIEAFVPSRKWFPRSHVLDVTLSEPRDVLQSERTLLTFVRFTTSLYFTAIGMILGFRLQSAGEPTTEPSLPNFNDSLFNRIISFLLISLAFATLVMSGINYFRTVRRYSQKRIHTYGFNNTTMMICVTAIVVTLIGINISLIVERVMLER